MNNFRDKLQQFMMGRYGMDQLGRFTMYASLAFLLISALSRNNWFFLIALILIITTYERMLSKNHANRYAENDKFLEWKDKFLGFFKGGAKQAKDKEHSYFRCPNCHQKIRVPKGKGTISIRCPKCSHEFIKRT